MSPLCRIVDSFSGATNVVFAIVVLAMTAIAGAVPALFRRQFRLWIKCSIGLEFMAEILGILEVAVAAQQRAARGLMRTETPELARSKLELFLECFFRRASHAAGRLFLSRKITAASALGLVPLIC